MTRLTFRQWSICVSLGEPGIAIMQARRQARWAVAIVQRAVLRDAMIHGTGIYRTEISMGEGCTRLKRVDPMKFYRVPFFGPDGSETSQ